MPKSHVFDHNNYIYSRDKSKKKKELSLNQKKKMYKRDMKKRNQKERDLCAQNKFFTLTCE